MPFLAHVGVVLFVAFAVTVGKVNWAYINSDANTYAALLGMFFAAFIYWGAVWGAGVLVWRGVRASVRGVRPAGSTDSPAKDAADGGGRDGLKSTAAGAARTAGEPQIVVDAWLQTIGESAARFMSEQASWVRVMPEPPEFDGPTAAAFAYGVCDSIVQSIDLDRTTFFTWLKFFAAKWLQTSDPKTINETAEAMLVLGTDPAYRDTVIAGGRAFQQWQKGAKGVWAPVHLGQCTIDTRARSGKETSEWRERALKAEQAGRDLQKQSEVSEQARNQWRERALKAEGEITETRNRVAQLNSEIECASWAMLEIANGVSITQYDIDTYGHDLITAVRRWTSLGALVLDSDSETYGADLIAAVQRWSRSEGAVSEQDRDTYGEQLIASVRRWVRAS